MHRFNGRRRALGLLVLPIALLGVAAMAMAAKPVPGATYAGNISQSPNTYPISFKTSSSGKKVSKFSLPSGYPIYCQGGGFGSPKSKSAKVSNKGKFTAKLPLIFAPTHQNQGKLIVTGKFGKHGTEKGTAITKFKTTHSCNGTSKYTASIGD